MSNPTGNEPGPYPANAGMYPTPGGYPPPPGYQQQQPNYPSIPGYGQQLGYGQQPAYGQPQAAGQQPFHRQLPAYGQPPGYGPSPYANQPTNVAWLAKPALGWILLAAAALMVIGSVTPWATAFAGELSKAGTDGDGMITLVVGLALVAAGILIGLQRGRRWIAITAAVIAVLTAFVPIYDASDISNKSEGLGDIVSVGYGLWLTLVAACAAAVVAVIAVFAPARA